MATEKPRYTVSVDRELFQKIEDFCFQTPLSNSFRSNSGTNSFRFNKNGRT